MSSSEQSSFESSAHGVFYMITNETCVVMSLHVFIAEGYARIRFLGATTDDGADVRQIS